MLIANPPDTGSAMPRGNPFFRPRRKQLGSPPPRRSRSARLTAETLEDRRVLAAVLDLLDASDSGRSDQDNITNAVGPASVVFSLSPVLQIGSPLLNPFTVVYVNGNPIAQPLALPVPIANSVDVNAFLQEGENNIRLTAEYLNLDPSAGTSFGVGAEADLTPGTITFNTVDAAVTTGETIIEASLVVTLDTIAPTGAGNLAVDSDSGIDGFTATFADRITSDRTPRFFGVAEANTIVTVSIDGTPAGTTVAVPLDGNEAFPPPANVQANWTIDSHLNLPDGEHTAVFTIEDVAGNQFTTAPVAFFVDTRGPRVSGLRINDIANTYDLLIPRVQLPVQLHRSTRW